LFYCQINERAVQFYLTATAGGISLRMKYQMIKTGINAVFDLLIRFITVKIGPAIIDEG